MTETFGHFRAFAAEVRGPHLLESLLPSAPGASADVEVRRVDDLDGSGLSGAEIGFALAGLRVRVHPERILWSMPDPLPEWLALCLVTRALPLWRERMGDLLLHGSCVATNGGATALLAASGVGKSTLAMDWIADGALLLSDDTVAVDASVAIVRPSYPLMKLRADALERHGIRRGALSRVLSWSDKYWLPCPYEGWGAYLDCPCPLERIVVLECVGVDDRPELVPLTGQRALAALLAHWPVPIDTADREARRLTAAARLLRGVPVFALTVPYGDRGRRRALELLSR